MPVHIAELESEVTAFEGEIELSDQQLERIVQRVLERLEDARREARYIERAVAVTTAVSGPAPIFKG